jgi:uncharacterized protein YbbC (DUF1343 family)
MVPDGSAGVTLGIDTLSKQGFSGLAGKRVGLVTNPSGVDARGIRTSDILSRQKSLIHRRRRLYNRLTNGSNLGNLDIKTRHFE